MKKQNERTTIARDDPTVNLSDGLLLDQLFCMVWVHLFGGVVDSREKQKVDERGGDESCRLSQETLQTQSWAYGLPRLARCFPVRLLDPKKKTGADQKASARPREHFQALVFKAIASAR